MADASSNLPALSLSGITKVYRLYRKPMYRVLDLLGICPPGESFYSEHAALAGVDLSIHKGEKVAVIGRNGAGKSTLLKIITQVIRPTAGTMDVRGKISALLQIGTGFHPDFTGRQNAYSAMAHQGITGRAADRKFDEVVEFSELDDFMDQPMKTYSTGMCARLMFSSAIVLEPDILVVDEVLGVGDAYFTHKSFNRMRDLCKGHGTTLLLVTHDIYSAMNLCDRFIWIDKGKVMFDGDAKTAISRYEASIKQQEEDRLRTRNLAALDRKEGKAERLTVSIRSRTGFALPAPLSLDRLELVFDRGDRSVLNVAEGSSDWALLPEGNMGPPEVIDGAACRQLVPAGSIYHKAEWSVALPPDAIPRQLRLRWRYQGSDAAEVRIIDDRKHVLTRGELHDGRGWEESEFSIDSSSSAAVEQSEQTQYGSGLIRIASVEFLDPDGNKVVKMRHGGELTLRVVCLPDWTRLKTAEITFSLAFGRPGSPYGAYAVYDRLKLPRTPEAALLLTIDPLLLGSGQWMVSVGIGEPGLYEEQYSPYFTVNPRWHHFLARGFEFEIESASNVDTMGCFLMLPTRIHVEDGRRNAECPSRDFAGEMELARAE